MSKQLGTQEKRIALAMVEIRNALRIIKVEKLYAPRYKNITTYVTNVFTMNQWFITDEELKRYEE